MEQAAVVERPARATLPLTPGDLTPIREAATRTGVSQSTIRRWDALGVISRYDDGGVKLVSVAEVARLRKRDGYASLKEATARLHVDFEKAKAICASLPHMRIGHDWLIDREALEQEAERIQREREEWVPMREAERRTPLNLAALQRLRDDGLLAIRLGAVKGGPGGIRRAEQLVHLPSVAELVDELAAQPKLCPGCGLPALPGRRWHNECKSRAAAEAQQRLWGQGDPDVCEPLRREYSRRMLAYWNSADGQVLRARLSSERRLGIDVECALCGASVYVKPSKLAWIEREDRRSFCDACWPAWTRLLGKARGAVRDSDPHHPTSPASREAFQRALRFGEELADDFFERVSRPKGGRRPEIALDLAVEALHVRGFSDAGVGMLLKLELGEKRNAEYVRTRRRRGRIKRPEHRVLTPLS